MRRSERHGSCKQTETATALSGALITAGASVLLLSGLLHLLPHLLPILFMGIVALFPFGQEYLAPFGGIHRLSARKPAPTPVGNGCLGLHVAMELVVGNTGRRHLSCATLHQ